MRKKRGRILWIDNEVADVRQAAAETEDRYSEKQIYVTPKPYISFFGVPRVRCVHSKGCYRWH